MYVRAFPGPGAPVQISDDGGKEPVWSHDSRRHFYRGSRLIISAQLATTGGLVAVTSRTRFIADAFDGGMPHANFDVTPDGERLLVLGPTATRGSETIVVVNWLAELRRPLGAVR